MKIGIFEIDNNTDKDLLLAIRAVVKAGDKLSKRQNIHADSLVGKDIKLSSDKQSESLIIQELSESEYPIISEENGLKGTINTSSKYWIVDPLDGTMNYFKGMDDLSCISVALWEDEKPILGCIYRFKTSELFYGKVGSGAFLNNKKILTSEITDTSQAVLATGFPVKRTYDTESLLAFVKNVQIFKKIRMLGTAAVMGAFVASGRIDAYIEDEIMLWDIAASSAIVLAAGGEVNIKHLDDYKCICHLFATKKLMEDFNAKSL